MSKDESTKYTVTAVKGQQKAAFTSHDDQDEAVRMARVLTRRYPDWDFSITKTITIAEVIWTSAPMREEGS